MTILVNYNYYLSSRNFSKTYLFNLLINHSHILPFYLSETVPDAQKEIDIESTSSI